MLRKGEIKRNFRIKREEEAKPGALGVFLVPCCGASINLRTTPFLQPHEKFGASFSRKDRAASDTQEERPERRNPWAAPEVGEGRLASYGAWCQEQLVMELQTGQH